MGSAAVNDGVRQLGLFLPGTNQTTSYSRNMLLRDDRATDRSSSCPWQEFVLKVHRTKKWHLDFRLCDLWIARSWSVYEMPSCSPMRSCTAVQVEDHLRRYIGFEGVHPETNLGAGPTMVWDSGLWRPLPAYVDIARSLDRGELKFTVDGKQMRGLWSLTRCGADGGEEMARWTLKKEPDAFAMEDDIARGCSLGGAAQLADGADSGGDGAPVACGEGEVSGCGPSLFDF